MLDQQRVSGCVSSHFMLPGAHLLQGLPPPLEQLNLGFYYHALHHKPSLAVVVPQGDVCPREAAGQRILAVRLGCAHEVVERRPACRPQDGGEGRREGSLSGVDAEQPGHDDG